MEQITDDSLGIRGIGGERQPIDVWFVYLPANEDREKYILNCQATSTVSLINFNNEVLHKIPVGKANMQYIDFPLDSKQLGSPVLCGNIGSHNQPFVIDVYESGETFSLMAENQKSLRDKTQTGLADVTVKGKKGQIFINVDSELEEGGLLSINVTNKSKKGTFEINVNGELNVKNTGKTNILSSDEITLLVFDGNDEGKQSYLKYTNNKGLFYKDEFDNEMSFQEGVAQIISKKIKLSGGKEPLVLGDTFADLFSKFIEEVSNITTTTSIGIQPILNKAVVLAYKEKVESIKSKISFTD